MMTGLEERERREREGREREDSFLEVLKTAACVSRESVTCDSGNFCDRSRERRTEEATSDYGHHQIGQNGSDRRASVD